MVSPEQTLQELVFERAKEQDEWLEARGLDPKRSQTVYTEKGQKLYRYIADNNSKSILVSANDFGFEEIPYDKLAGCEIQNDGFTSNSAERATAFGIISGVLAALILWISSSNFYEFVNISIPVFIAILLCVALPFAAIGALTASKQVVRHRIAFLLNDPEMEFRAMTILKPFAAVGSQDYLAVMRFSQNVRLSVLSIVNSRGENKNG